MNCPNCGQANSNTAKFCVACGRPLAAPVPIPIPAQPQTEVVSARPQWLKRLPTIGALFVILCFFFPWIMVSCSVDILHLTQGQGIQLSGFDIASGNVPEMPGGDTLQDLFYLTGLSVFNMPKSYSVFLFFFPLMALLGLISLNGKLSGLIVAFFAGLLGLIGMLLFLVGVSQMGKELAEVGMRLQFRLGFWGACFGFLWQTVTAVIGMAKK